MLRVTHNLDSSKQSSELVLNQNNIPLNVEQEITLPGKHVKTLDEIFAELSTAINEQKELKEESSRIEQQRNDLIAENHNLRALLNIKESDEQQLLATIQEKEWQIAYHLRRTTELVQLQAALQDKIDHLQQQRCQERQLTQQAIQQERLEAQQRLQQEHLTAEQRIADLRNKTTIIQTNISVLEKSVEVIRKIFERFRTNRDFVRSNYDSSRFQPGVDQNNSAIFTLKGIIQAQRSILNGSAEGILNNTININNINHLFFSSIRDYLNSLKECIIGDKQILESHLPSNTASYILPTSSMTFTGPNGYLSYLDSHVRGYTVALDTARWQLQKEPEDDGCAVRIATGIAYALTFPVSILAIVDESIRILNIEQRVDELELGLSRWTNERAMHAEKLERVAEAQRVIDLANTFLNCSNINLIVNLNLDPQQNNYAVVA